MIVKNIASPMFPTFRVHNTHKTCGPPKQLNLGTNYSGWEYCEDDMRIIFGCRMIVIHDGDMREGFTLKISSKRDTTL